MIVFITWTEKYFKVAVSPERGSLPGASQTRNETISTLMKINTSKLEERNFQPTLSIPSPYPQLYRDTSAENECPSHCLKYPKITVRNSRK